MPLSTVNCKIFLDKTVGVKGKHPAHIRYKIFLVLYSSTRIGSFQHPIDFTFRLQRYIYKYCNNLQCQLSLYSAVLPGVPTVCGTSLKNILLPSRSEGQILCRCRLDGNGAMIIRKSTYTIFLSIIKENDSIMRTGKIVYHCWKHL